MITDLGDPGILLPFSIVVAAILAFSGAAGTAFRLLASIAVCCGLTVLAKVGFVTLAGRLPIPPLSPSGHVALSTAAYGAVAMIAATALHRTWKPVAPMAAAGMIAAVAASRLLLHRHNLTEVVIGLAIGGACVAGFAAVARRETFLKVRPAVVAVSFAAIVAIFHGTHLTLEHKVRPLSARLERAVQDVNSWTQ
jgi:membrane-associated phospholipid phosphatase